MGADTDSQSPDWDWEQTWTTKANPPLWEWERCVYDMVAAFSNVDPAVQQIDADEAKDQTFRDWLEWADTAVDYLKERGCFVPLELLLEHLAFNRPCESWFRWWDLERTILLARTLMYEMVSAGQVVEATVSDVAEKGCWCEGMPEWRQRDWRSRRDCWCIRNGSRDEVPVIGLPHVMER